MLQMVLLDTYVHTILLHEYFYVKLHFKNEFFFKWLPSGCPLALYGSWEKDFPQSNMLKHGGKTPQELLSRAPFLREVALADRATT
jgi:hypothetical protein